MSRWALIFCFIVIPIIIAFLFVHSGHTPFPTDYLRAWYEPWKSETSINGVPTIPHKAVGQDVFRQIYPFKALSIDLLRRGMLPLWNPYNGAGQPLFAGGVLSLLNPFMLGFLVLDPNTAWTILFVMQFAVIGASYILYARAVGISQFSAYVSALLLIGSGFVVANSIYATFMYSFAGLPLLLYSVETIRQQKRVGWIVLPLAISWTILTGFPQLTLYIFLTVGAYSLYRLWGRSVRFWWKIGLIGILGVTLSAIQLLPLYELYRASSISTKTSEFIFTTFLMPVSHLVTVLVPNFFGNPSTYNYWGYADYIETASTIGSFGILLALFGYMQGKKHPIQTFFLGVIGGSLLLSLRSPFTEFLYRLPVPILTTGVPTRVLGLFTFACAILAGFGLDSLPLIKRKRLFLWGAGTWGMVAALGVTSLVLMKLGISCQNSAISSCFMISTRNSILELLVLTIGIVILLIYRTLPPKYSSLSRVMIVILLCTSLGYNAYKFIPVTVYRRLMPEHPLLSELSRLQPDRVGYVGTVLPTDIATAYRFFDTNYYNPLSIRRYGELVSYVNTGDRISGITRSDVHVVAQASVSADLAARRSRFWDITATSVTVVNKKDGVFVVGKPEWEDPHWAIYRRATALPRVYIVSHVDTISEPDKELNQLFGEKFLPDQNALVEKPLLQKISGEASGSATILSYSPNLITIMASSTGTGFLVLSDTYMSGWRATVDGKDTPIYRTNYAFRGIILPAGKHDVRFSYMPDSFQFGMVISIGAFLIWVGYIFFEKSRNRL